MYAQAKRAAIAFAVAKDFRITAVNDALCDNRSYKAQALIALGYPAPGTSPRPRPEPDLTTFVQTR